MPRIFLILGLATCTVFGWMFYQYSAQQKELRQLQIYQTVYYEKAELIYQQAQDWSKPIEVNVSDNRLQGDYQVMADFVLSAMIQNAEARNQYLRELKAMHWDQFLNIDRLDRDRKQQYAETGQMLQQAHVLAKRYQQQSLVREENTLARAKQLSIKSHLRHQLADSLRESRDSDQTHALFALELQVLDHADALFQILKNNPWEKKNRTFMFYQEQPIRQFNDVYQQILQLNAEMEKIKKQNRQEIEQRF